MGRRSGTVIVHNEIVMSLTLWILHTKHDESLSRATIPPHPPQRSCALGLSKSASSRNVQPCDHEATKERSETRNHVLVTPNRGKSDD